MHAERSGRDWIQTYTGKMFWPLDPRAEDIDPVDIAHALGNLCRYAGHVKTFYSVAEHSVLMSNTVDPENALWALVHDASEAYLVDIPRPVKNHPSMAPYREAEDRLLLCVAERFGLPPEMPAQVVQYDTQIVVDERAQLLGPVPGPWGALEGMASLGVRVRSLTPYEAEHWWLARLAELTGEDYV